MSLRHPRGADEQSLKARVRVSTARRGKPEEQNDTERRTLKACSAAPRTGARSEARVDWGGLRWTEVDWGRLGWMEVD
eukprot:1142680-Rhodomonas_salina.2